MQYQNLKAMDVNDTYIGNFAFENEGKLRLGQFFVDSDDSSKCNVVLFEIEEPEIDDRCAELQYLPLLTIDKKTQPIQVLSAIRKEKIYIFSTDDFCIRRHMIFRHGMGSVYAVGKARDPSGILRDANSMDYHKSSIADYRLYAMRFSILFQYFFKKFH